MNPNIPKPAKRRLGAWKTPTTCPGCDRPDTISVACLPSVQAVQGTEVACDVEKWHCSACGAEWMSPGQATAAVATAVRVFQERNGLLTATECRTSRNALGWTQDRLAAVSGVGIATIKRLEGCVHVINKLQNNALRGALAEAEREPVPDYQLDFGGHVAVDIPSLGEAAGNLVFDSSSWIDSCQQLPCEVVESGEPALCA